MDNKADIKSLSFFEIKDLVSDLSLPAFRSKQLVEWLYGKHVVSFDEMTNLPKKLRAQLNDRFIISSGKVILRQESADGTRKYLICFSDGVSVETVGIPSRDGSRLTVCFSTQAGCPIGCTFCATGRSGFTRNLSCGEMFDQVAAVADDFGQRVSNVVAMGQGEPFLNFDAVSAALHFMNDSTGLGIGARHITVSTCGVIEGIKRFESEPQYTLAVSLHSAIQHTRDRIMPGVSSINLTDLRSALVHYASVTHRRPSLEYALIRDINDDDEHLAALIAFCHEMLCHVNLIPLNPIASSDSLDNPVFPSERLEFFKRVLEASHIEVSVRDSRGSDIDGACGQLRQRLG